MQDSITWAGSRQFTLRQERAVIHLTPARLGHCVRSPQSPRRERRSRMNGSICCRSSLSVTRRCDDARARSPFRNAIRYSSRLKGHSNHGSAWVVMPTNYHVARSLGAHSCSLQRCHLDGSRREPALPQSWRDHTVRTRACVRRHNMDTFHKAWSA